MKTYHCSSVSEWMDKIQSHACPVPDMVGSDNPLTRTVGCACANCGEEFQLGLSEYRATIGELKEESQKTVNEAIKTPDGRTRLIQLLRAKA